MPANLTFDDMTGTPVVTKGMPPPLPSPPPPPQPSGPVLFVASDAFMLSEEEDDLSKPSPKHSGFAEPSKYILVSFSISN